MLELGIFRHLWVLYSESKKIDSVVLLDEDSMMVGHQLNTDEPEDEDCASEAEFDKSPNGSRGVEAQSSLDAKLEGLTQEQKEDLQIDSIRASAPRISEELAYESRYTEHWTKRRKR
ncbi:MAG: hypothetical protein Q9187_009018 [Circinaria calcarea]